MLATVLIFAIPNLNVMAEPAAKCKFVYTDEIQREIMAPAVKSAARGQFYLYDLKAPNIKPYRFSNDGVNRLLLITFDKKGENHFPKVSVIFDPCLKRVVPAGPFE
jgi:hypothetical protein